MANRLAQESSPYLRQHANNPVDWYPWNEEALARARAENKPILLSVGYSACHWCHVMEHESFENPEIARLMNENFINIKVDREERPDLDQIYQNVAQLMTRSGGWPLTVFLTPELKPFFGGTYFPPEDRYGRPGFPRVLTALSEAFKNEKNAIDENAQKLTDAIKKIESSRADGNERPDLKSLRRVVDAVVSGIDWRNGGFGGAPKFPNPMNLALLWRYGVASGFGMAQEAVVLSLTRMAEGGIYDHLGGGFHRYSVDERWSVPHFEKMLYDNALLLKLYSEVLLSSAPDALPVETRALFTQVVAETTRYVLREMRGPENAFYSTQDADSEGEEGKFFVWDASEVRAVVEPAEADAFLLRYGVTDHGNFEETGKTVLHAAMPVSEVASRLQITTHDATTRIESARKKLFDAREKRIKPGRDEKIIASWNGLMISGLVWAAAALRQAEQGPLGEEAFESATTAMDFARGMLARGENRLYSVYKDKQARFNGYLDDYAFLAMGALDLARLMDDDSETMALITLARTWVDIVRKHFADRDGGGFFFTSDDHEKLLQRPKTIYDQAIPSGNAVMAECLIALAEITASRDYEREADELIYSLFPTALQAPQGTGELSCAALMQVMGPVVVSGPSASSACFHPHVFQKAPEKATKDLLVCHRKSCELPMTDTKAVKKMVGTKLLIG